MCSLVLCLLRKTNRAHFFPFFLACRVDFVAQTLLAVHLDGSNMYLIGHLASVAQGCTGMAAACVTLFCWAVWWAVLGREARSIDLNLESKPSRASRCLRSAGSTKVLRCSVCDGVPRKKAEEGELGIELATISRCYLVVVE